MTQEETVAAFLKRLHRDATVDSLRATGRFQGGEVADRLSREIDELPRRVYNDIMRHALSHVERQLMIRPDVNVDEQRIEIPDADATVIPLADARKNATRVRAIDATGDDFWLWLEERAKNVAAQARALNVIKQHGAAFYEKSKLQPGITVLDEIKETHNRGWIVITDPNWSME